MTLLKRGAAALLPSLCVVGIGLALGLSVYAYRLPPINLDLTAERSPVILDREGRLLRAFTTEEGRWRL
ncbi:MAG: hypothetical protein ACKVON_12230, partial [Beijerinckiaceae bacterium]